MNSVHMRSRTLSGLKGCTVEEESKVLPPRRFEDRNDRGCTPTRSEERSTRIHVERSVSHCRRKRQRTLQPLQGQEALLIEIVLLGNRTLETELQAAADTVELPREKLLAVYLAYVSFAERHPDFFAVMFQSGIDKTPYPEVQASTLKAFGVAAKLAVEIELSQESADQLALATWTMAHGFAMLRVEGAMAGVGIPEAGISAEALARRLLYASRSAEAIIAKLP